MDYKEKFSPITKYACIRVGISNASEMERRIHQMDVKVSFLNGLIQEEVYIEKTRGFEVHRRESH